MSNVPHGARRRDVFLLYFPFIFPLFSPYIRGNYQLKFSGAKIIRAYKYVTLAGADTILVVIREISQLDFALWVGSYPTKLRSAGGFICRR